MNIHNSVQALTHWHTENEHSLVPGAVVGELYTGTELHSVFHIFDPSEQREDCVMDLEVQHPTPNTFCNVLF